MKNTQTSKNFLTNSFALFINIATGLFYTPYLINSLGIIGYGIVPLALIINQYINVLTGSLTGSLTRFYTIALQKGETDDAAKYISTAISTILLLVIILLPFSYLVVTNINSIFNIPFKFLNNAKFLFAYTLLSFFLSLFSSLLNSTLYAINRLDLINIINVARILLKVMLTVVFFETYNTNIEFIGVANLVAEIIVLLLSIYYFIKLTNRSVKIDLLRYYDRQKLIAVLSMTTWILIYQLGDTGLYRTDIILVNLFWGTKESGILGALANLGTYVTNIVGAFSSLFGPLVLIAYSKGDHNEVKRIIVNNTMLVGLITAGLVGILMGFAREITYLWLGKEFASYSIWLIIKLLPLPFFVAGGMFAFLFRSWNLVKLPAIFTLSISILNIIISLLLFNFFSHSIFIITISLLITAILIIIQTYLFGIWYTKKIYIEIGYNTFIMTTVYTIVTGFILYVLTKIYIIYFFSDLNLFSLLGGFVIVGIIGLIIVWYIIIPSKQKKYLLHEILNI